MTMIGAVLAVMMNTASASVLPLSLPQTFDPYAYNPIKETDSHAQMLCKKAAGLEHNPKHIIKKSSFQPYDLLVVSRSYWHGRNCIEDKDKAAEIFEFIIGDGPTSTVNPQIIKYLIDHHLRNDPGKLSPRVIKLNRMLWMQGYGPGYDKDGELKQLGWDKAQQIAFVSRDDIWEWPDRNTEVISGGYNLNFEKVRSQIMLDPASPRFDFEKGVALAIRNSDMGTLIKAARHLAEGKVVPSNPARAVTLLWPYKGMDYEDVHAQLVNIILPLLNDANSIVRAKALADMQELSNTTFVWSSQERAKEAVIIVYEKHLKSSQPSESLKAQAFLNAFVLEGLQSAKTALLPHITNQLKSGDAEQRRAAFGSMTALLRSGDVSTQLLLDEDIKRTGGLVKLTNNNGLMFTITENDIPQCGRMQRCERPSGVVSITVIFAPNGRVVKTVKLDGGDDDLLGAVSSRAYAAQLNGYVGRYVIAELPVVSFLPELKDKALKIDWRNTK
jgi:hypothetical protein